MRQKWIWISPIDGERMVTLQVRVWRWEVRALAADGWIVNWSRSPLDWLRPMARKHLTMSEAQAAKTRYLRAMLDRLAA